MAIASTEAWRRLQRHVSDIQATHLRDLLQDADRCAAFTAEFDELLLDYSRSRVTLETMVRCLRYDFDPSPDIIFMLAAVALRTSSLIWPKRRD